MLTSSSGGDDIIRSLKREDRTQDLSRSSKKKKRTELSRSLGQKKGICTDVAETTEQISGDLLCDTNQDVFGDLNKEVALKVSNSVVSLVCSDGDTVLCACSGIAVERVGSVTRFITSASLIRSLDGKREDNLKLEVRLEDTIVNGFLGEYDLDRDIAVINVVTFPDLHVVFPKTDVLNCESQTKVLAVGRDISGKLIAISGLLSGYSKKRTDCGRLMTSTCKIPKVCEGGPLFDLDGKFLGMNLCLGEKGSIFMPDRVVVFLLPYRDSLERQQFPERSIFCKQARVLKGITVHRNTLSKNQLRELESLGYPKPSKSMLNDGMILTNTFEDPFGDEYCNGVWSELSGPVSSNICQTTVALASFREKRLFACTGIFIEWNGCTPILTSGSLVRTCHYTDKIDEKLRIEVLLPNNERAEATLQHCNLRYNVALVTVKDFHPCHPAKVEKRLIDTDEVVAVGRCFKHGNLMAARGSIFVRAATLKFVGHSNCQISKAGIGGPLLHLDGRFVGMNFYEGLLIGTPYILCRDLLRILECFKRKRTVAEIGYDDNVSHELCWTLDGDRNAFPRRWAVPDAHWCHPEDVAKLEPCAIDMYASGDGEMLYLC
ncbi:hypothetical protein ACP4OV_019408 [Aristida adscensionis]